MTKGCRAITRPTIDGGTRLTCSLPNWKPTKDMARLLAHLRDGDTPTRGQVDMPLPQTDLFGPVVATYVVTGTRRERVSFHVHDRVYFTVNVETGNIRLQLKARELWAHGGGADGARASLSQWLPNISAMFTSRAFDLEAAPAHGWSVSGVELCADFVGLRFNSDDAEHFMGRSKKKLTAVDRGELRSVRLGDKGVETIELGHRSTSEIALCIYDKSREIAVSQGGDASKYSEVWKAAGWQGEGVFRVEFRVRNKALQLTPNDHAETGEILDFRNPVTLCSQSNLDQLWAVLAWKKRLVIPRDDMTRRDRWKTDPRWEAVAGATQLDLEFGRDWKRRRLAEKACHLERLRKADEDVVKAHARACALRGLDPAEMTAAEHRDVTLEALDHGEETVNLATYGRAYMARQRNLLAPEIEAERVAYRRRAQARAERRLRGRSKKPRKAEDPRPTIEAG